MSKYFGFITSAKYCAALCLICCAAFVGCNDEDDFVMPVDDEEASVASDDSEYDTWVQNFTEEMKKSGAVGADGVVSTQGVGATTGAVPAFNFASAATTGAIPAFNFGAAASSTTGAVPAFNFNVVAAGTTASAPAFNFSAATAGTTASTPAFNFNLVAEKAEAERKAAEEKAAAEKAAAEKAEAERIAAEEKAAAEKAAAEKAEAERVAAEKAEAERIAAEEKAAAEKAEAERVAAEKAEAERIAAEKAEAERIAAEKAEAERIAAEEKAAAEKAEAERVAAEKAEAERIAAEKAEAERIAAEEKAAAEKAEAERVAAEKAEAERIAAEKAEAERIAAEEKAAAEKAEAERVAAEKAEAERVAAEKAEAERKAAEEASAAEAEGEAAPATEGEGETAPAAEGEGETAPAAEGEGEAVPAAEGEGEGAPDAEGEGETAPDAEAEGEGEAVPAEPPAEENTTAFFFSEVNGAYSESVEELPSAANLESAIDSLIESLERDIDDLEMIPNFEDGVLGVRRDANALAVVAMTLGVSDYDAPVCGSVSGMMAAAAELARAETVADVKKAYQSLLAAREKPGAAKELDWAKVADLSPLMKYALPSLTTEVKRLARNEKTFLRGKNTKKVIDDSTIIVAIALGCRENVGETLAPDEDELWREYCERLAAASLEFNKQANAVAAKEGSFDDMKAAFEAVDDTCNSTCHETFGGSLTE